MFGITYGKLLGILGVLVVYTFGVWHITNTYNKASLLEDKLSESTQAIKSLQKNQDLSKEIQKSLETYFAKAKPITKEIQREIITNHVYDDCKSTDGVMRNYREKLEQQ